MIILWSGLIYSADLLAAYSERLGKFANPSAAFQELTTLEASTRAELVNESDEEFCDNARNLVETDAVNRSDILQNEEEQRDQIYDDFLSRGKAIIFMEKVTQPCGRFNKQFVIAPLVAVADDTRSFHCIYKRFQKRFPEDETDLCTRTVWYRLQATGFYTLEDYEMGRSLQVWKTPEDETEASQGVNLAQLKGQLGRDRILCTLHNSFGVFWFQPRQWEEISYEDYKKDFPNTRKRIKEIEIFCADATQAITEYYQKPVNKNQDDADNADDAEEGYELDEEETQLAPQTARQQLQTAYEKTQLIHLIPGFATL